MSDPITPMEPMDTYLCVLLDLNLISSSAVYTQTQICGIISNNQTSFNAIYNNATARQAVRDEYLEEAKRIKIIDKDQDCG